MPFSSTLDAAGFGAAALAAAPAAGLLPAAGSAGWEVFGAAVAVCGTADTVIFRRFWGGWAESLAGLVPIAAVEALEEGEPVAVRLGIAR